MTRIFPFRLEIGDIVLTDFTNLMRTRSNEEKMRKESNMEREKGGGKEKGGIPCTSQGILRPLLQ